MTRVFVLTPARRSQRLANVARIAAARRARTHCGRGHRFTPENTYRRSDGSRECATCKADRDWYRSRGLGMTA
jgi:hypothetical protein